MKGVRIEASAPIGREGYTWAEVFDCFFDEFGKTPAEVEEAVRAVMAEIGDSPAAIEEVVALLRTKVARRGIT